MEVLIVRLMFPALLCLIGGIALGGVTTSPAPTTREATTQRAPVAAPHPLEKLVNSMPKNLWPSNQETSAVKIERNAWIREHLTANTMPTWAWSGVVEDVSKDGKTATVRLAGNPMTFCGDTYTTKIHATIVNAPTETFSWQKGAKVSVNGTPIVSQLIAELPTAFSSPRKELIIAITNEAPTPKQSQNTQPPPTKHGGKSTGRK